MFSVGKIVSEAAAKHLTPVVLELGGQCPAIVTRTANLDHAAKRIALSKYINAGQICLASNHVFCDPSIAERFQEKLKHHTSQFLLENGKDDLVRIINDKQFDRISGLLDKTSGTVAYGGKSDKADRYIEPTIVTQVKL